MSLNAKLDDHWPSLAASFGVRKEHVEDTPKSLLTMSLYDATLPFLQQHWPEVLRDRCTSTNSAFIRQQHLSSPSRLK